MLILTEMCLHVKHEAFTKKSLVYSAEGPYFQNWVLYGGVDRALALHSKGRLFIWMKIHGLTNLKDFVHMAEQLEHLSGNNECCSAPSPRSNPFTTYVKDILSGSTKNTVTEL